MRQSSYVPSQFQNKQASLENIVLDDFYSYVCGDLARFAHSSVESYISALTSAKNGKSQAWACISLYYSAFYAAQFLMRIAGFHSCYIDRNEMRDLKTVASNYSANWNAIDGGQFLLDARDVRRPGTSLILNQYVGKMGSHQYFWSKFVEILQYLEGYGVQENTVWYPDFLSAFTQLKLILKFNRSHEHQWLSRVRNDINYRHGMEAWFPASSRSGWKKNFPDHQIKVPSQYRLDFAYPGQAEVAFINCCKFIFTTMLEVADDCTNFNKRNGSFGGEWVRAKNNFKDVLKINLN